MKNVRSKVVSKISKIKEVEDFNFSNWLKRPAIHHQPVEEITSSVITLPEFSTEVALPESSEYKFDMNDPEVFDELKNIDFQRVRSNAIFFMIPLPTDKSVDHTDVEIKHLSYSARGVEFLFSNTHIKQVKMKFDYTPPFNYDCKLQVPDSFNYLSDMVPAVLNIDMLDFEDLIKSVKKIKVRIIEIDQFDAAKTKMIELPVLPDVKKIYRIKVPSMGTYKLTHKKIIVSSFQKPSITESYSFEFSKVKNWYANFRLSRGESYLFYRSVGSKYTSDLELKSDSQNIYSQFREQLSFILSNVKKIDWEKAGTFKIKLMPFEEAAVKFLVENDYALLQDELGIDIQREVITALNILFNQKFIKSALIITNSSKIGNEEFANRLNTEIGWIDKIKKQCPGITTGLIEGSNDQRSDLWNKSRKITVADLETALSDHHLKILEDKVLQKIDCIIIDSIDQVLLNKELGRNFLLSINPKILWVTSSILAKNLQRELNNELNPDIRIKNVQIRSKVNISDDLPRFLLNEFWCEADEEQLNEFKMALVECKKELRRVLESGNPLRFYANIFTLYHRLNQVGNFAANKTRSPKAELLLEHLLNIKANGKKALILTQYERLGIKKIVELLSKYGINHITAPSGMSAEEIKKAIASFKSQKEVVAFVTDAKTSRLKFSDIDVPFVVKFDQWWNPISNWELEDMFTTQSGEETFQESVNMFNYYSLGTLDQKIRELLIDSGLINRNVFELMQPKLYEELVSINEWLKIFSMPVSSETKKVETPEAIVETLKTLSGDEFRKILTRFFTIIGYSNLDFKQLPNSTSFSIVGKAQRNNRQFFLVSRVFSEGMVDKLAIEKILSETSSSKQDKIFIITRDSLPEISDESLRSNVTLMDGLSLAKFLLRVGITISSA